MLFLQVVMKLKILENLNIEGRRRWVRWRSLSLKIFTKQTCFIVLQAILQNKQQYHDPPSTLQNIVQVLLYINSQKWIPRKYNFCGFRESCQNLWQSKCPKWRSHPPYIISVLDLIEKLSLWPRFWKVKSKTSSIQVLWEIDWVTGKFVWLPRVTSKLKRSSFVTVTHVWIDWTLHVFNPKRHLNTF